MKPMTFNLTLMARDMASRGWMRTDLARAAGVSDMTVYRWFDGTARTNRTAKKLALALGHTVDRYLLRDVKSRVSA